MSSRAGVCNFYARDGRCRFGNKCKFLHETPAARPNQQTSSATPLTPRNLIPRPSGVPRDTCNFFWTTGTCNRSFDCSFKHVRGSVASASATTPDTSAAAEEDPDFFSREGLITTGGVPRDRQVSLGPSAAHNNILPFLKKNYHFADASRVQGFVNVLGSIDDQNKLWSSDTAQAFLETMVKGNGIIRIGDALRFQPVSHHAAVGVLSFQKGYFPILEFMTTDLILKSTLHKNINHLYSLLKNNFDEVRSTVHTCVTNMVDAKSWKDPGQPGSSPNALTGVVAFKTLSSLYLTFFHIFKDCLKDHPNLVDMVDDLGRWFEVWSSGVSTAIPSFDDPIVYIDRNARRLLVAQLRSDIEKLAEIVARESGRTEQRRIKQPRGSGMTAHQRREAHIAQLAQTYNPPGELRPEGPRHDNDFTDIAKIRVAPTHEELLSDGAYLPVFSPEAPHHLRENSMERHLDIQFRLLREELIAPIRSSVMAIHNDVWMALNAAKQRHNSVGTVPAKTKLEELLKKRGGAYKTSGFDSLFFQVYTNIKFSPVKAERRSLTVGLSLDAPSGTARDKDHKKRYAYWEHSKRLQSGSLVVLMIITSEGATTYLGVVSSFSKDIAESSKASEETIQIQVSFFDPQVEFMALRNERISSPPSYAILLDNSVMYEASRPFLETLQTVEPTEIPFSRYIARHDSIADVQILPPKYATAPGFKFKLQCLAKNSRVHIDDVDISQPMVLERARQQLHTGSTLDPSQLDAVLNTLVREVSLIQGPPGTGKSYTGREILKVLFASKIRPIVLIAYTNHALDHMLSEILDSNITSKMVRLGSRSSNERIAEYTLDKLEKVASKSNLDRSIGQQYRMMKEIEEQMSNVMQSIQLPRLDWHAIKTHLSIHSPDQAAAFGSPPFWVQKLYNDIRAEADKNGEWTTQGKPTQAALVGTLYEFWKDGRDVEFISPPGMQPAKKKPKKQTKSLQQNPVLASAHDPSVLAFFQELGFGSEVPRIPTSKRPTPMLLDTPNIWSMSLDERARLAAEWERDIRLMVYQTHLDEYNRLREDYKEACKHYNNARDETRRRLLATVDLIGCTTTGAAKLTSLITSVAPRVLMVEEAGQVLEAHILTSLVSSVHHLICIGDPQQLRPTLATYGLSMDSERGKMLYKFDRSLMERLYDANMPMTQINVQRRMRPAISHFVRTILYPRLEDNELVHEYPHVQGMQSDVYFLSHVHPENGTEDSVSKYNEYEVSMIVDLVLYFLRQGDYSGVGDIAVLCAYLGQLQKVRAALRDLKIAVSVDERDEEQLAKQGLDEEVTFEQVFVTKHIRLGTVDIYQGQEAKIVIVSLVRNTGTYETNSASIGFLKSSNRINVALSRAKHGLYILGNSSNLRKNAVWSTIVDELENRSQIGPAFPIICTRHPDQVQLISEPGELSRLAPGGGCLTPCGSQMSCGHICPSVCHDARDNHKSMLCHMPCTRTPCPRKHPCSRRCSDSCGDCEFPMYDVMLPCGHEEAIVPCHLFDSLAEVKCMRPVVKQLAACEHQGTMPCHKDPATFRCMETCNGLMQCCSKICRAKCSACQKQSLDPAKPKSGPTSLPCSRTAHVPHPCERPLYCQHLCGQNCHPKDQGCNATCHEECRQQCVHQKCKKACSTPCAPCMEPCVWNCPHYKCPVACGSICARLPCDEPCQSKLTCGHQCPSVCGEPCDRQVCVVCLPAESERRQEVVDLIMQRSLDEIDLTSDDVAERLVTLGCGHTFTVETLDGHCEMSTYYEVDPMGVYIGLKAPPVDYKMPPVCPSCRGTISSPRYGRVAKRAILDVLEQNVASSMSRELGTLNPVLERVSATVPGLQDNAKSIAADADDITEPSKTRAEAAIGKTSEPLPAMRLDGSAMHTIHGFSTKESAAWNGLVKEILGLYRKAHSVSTKRGAHVQAYEAAVTTLYRLNLKAITTDPEKAASSRAPEAEAIDAARRDVGQPPHKADSQFQVEAYFRTLELRFMLGQIAYSRIEKLPMTLTDNNAVQHRGLWVSFVEFIYDSCREDAKKALAMAQHSSASRQAAHCGVYVIRSDFEKSRFQALIAESKLATLSNPGGRADREKRADNVKTMHGELNTSLDILEKDYLRSRPSPTMDALKAERVWFVENCRRKVDKFLKDLVELEEYVRKGGKYQLLSMQEMEDIIKAFPNFSTTGHFYRCPNGHPYVIDNCGGAMQQATCNECGEEIGGGSHRLLDSNTVAREYEDILRRRGVGQGFY